MPTMRYKRLNNFPPELMTLLQDKWDDIKDDGYSTEIVAMEPELNFVLCKTLNEVFQPYFSCELHGVLYQISDPSLGIAKVHTDKSRGTSLNIPIRVDSQGDYICGLTEDLSAYMTPRKKEFEATKKVGHEFPLQLDMMEFVPMTTPIIINAKVPHTWRTNKDTNRVVAGFLFGEGLKPEELINSTPSDWF